jgi:hypothetical protein
MVNKNILRTVAVAIFAIVFLGWVGSVSAVEYGPWTPTAVSGAFYRYMVVRPSYGHGRYIECRNQTSGWVTFFHYRSQINGTLNLSNLISQGMYVEVRPLQALDSGATFGKHDTGGYFWVWAMSGKWQIKDKQLLLAD